MRRPPKGFTLIELLVSLGIISILAMVALISTVQSRYDREIDQYAQAVIAAMKEARSRAISTGRRHVVDFYADSVQWCEYVCPPARPPYLTGSETHHYGKRYYAHSQAATIAYIAKVADFNLTSMPLRTAFPTGSYFQIWFKPDGTMDGDPSDPAPQGFTVYLQHVLKPSLKYRIVILPLSGELRKFNTWGD